MPAEIVTHFIAAIERMDLDHALSHLTDDCEYDNVPMGKTHGRDGVRDVLAPFLARCDELQWVVHHQVADGSLDNGVVMNERVDRFRIEDIWLELPVAGLFVIRHGQIALWRDYFDLPTFNAQLARLG